MKEVLMTTRAILVPVAAALVLVACREPASPASSSSPSTRPAFTVGGGQSGLSLHPGGLGEQSFAKWESHEGEPDAEGNADQALYFQKTVATPVLAAGQLELTSRSLCDNGPLNAGRCTFPPRTPPPAAPDPAPPRPRRARTRSPATSAIAQA